MTRIYALDLTGDRAELHLWSEDYWQQVGAVDLSGQAVPRVLAELLAPAMGQPLALVLPDDQISRLNTEVSDPDVLAATAQADLSRISDTEWRIDRHPAPDGGTRITAVAVETLAEAEDFMTALGVVPLGCMAAPDGGTGPAWFGLSDGPCQCGRASDRPAFLPDDPEPVDQRAIARRRALEAAQRDPAILRPLPETETGPDIRRRNWLKPLAGLALGKTQRRAGAVVAAVGLVAAALFFLPEGSRAPVEISPPLAATFGPVSEDGFETLALVLPSTQNPERAVLPVLGGRAVQTASAPPESPARADLSGMDAPEGMSQKATFFTASPVLRGTATVEMLTDLIYPGLDESFRTDALALDAITVPADPARVSESLSPPGSPEQTYVVDERGLIRPSPEGRLSPDGFLVVAGAPPSQTRPRPERTEPETVQVLRRADLPDDDPLRNLAPQLRPDSLAERFERDRLGGKTETELAGLAPTIRPESGQDAPEVQNAPATAQAVAQGPRPTARSAKVLASFKTAAAKVPKQAIAAAAVKTPSKASPKAATAKATTNARLDLSEVNLLGTYGTSRARRALVRLPTGQVMNLSVGDRVDGGRVAAISNGKLSYVKSGRTISLSMPRS